MDVDVVAMSGNLQRNLKAVAFFILLASYFLVVSAVGPLGIQQDKQAYAKTPALYLWSSVATFSQDNTQISNDAEFYGVAMQAYNEMAAAWAAQNIPVQNQPSVMSALGIGNEIYFSSSIKCGDFVYEYTDQTAAVTAALTKCQVRLQNTVQYTTLYQGTTSGGT